MEKKRIDFYIETLEGRDIGIAGVTKAQLTPSVDEMCAALEGKQTGRPVDEVKAEYAARRVSEEERAARGERQRRETEKIWERKSMDTGYKRSRVDFQIETLEGRDIGVPGVTKAQLTQSVGQMVAALERRRLDKGGNHP